ncbi:hypothetical protein NB717_003574 [Xanthomonas sacchari]|nr:hypothetical protein [Xanthomonas sacchari]
MGLAPELVLDLLVEHGAGQGIRHADADVVRARLRHQPTRGEDVVELLVQVAQLQEEADADALRAQPLARGDHAVHIGALGHLVEDALAAALRADPGLAAAGPRQGGGHALAAQVGTGLDGEGHRAVGGGQRIGEVLHPVHVEAEDVVGHPHMVGREAALELGHLRGHVLRLAALVVIAPDRLGAPVAAERAAARGGHVQTEMALSLLPERAVARDIQQVPGRRHRQPRIRRPRADLRALELRQHRAGHLGEAGHPARRVDVRFRLQPRHQVQQGRDAFADQHRVCTGRKERLRMVRGVGAGDDHPAAAGARLGDHPARGLAHPAQAHLGEEVEVVLVEHHQVRPLRADGVVVVLHALGQHRVEQRHLVSVLTQQCRHLQRGQRRVRLAAFPLLGVVAQEVGVADLDLEHRRKVSFGAAGEGRMQRWPRAGGRGGRCRGCAVWLRETPA